MSAPSTAGITSPSCQQNGGTLDEVGAVRDLAPGERIFSVRMMGDKGYVVTFEQVDPLFTLDLSSPTNPR